MARPVKRRPAPVVTVAVACYNCERHIEAALASAQRQTLTDIEIIVVDDGSTDRSVEVVRRIAAADPRVRLDILERNSGPGGARNRALDLARGQWFAVLDSDDLYHPERLERLVTHARDVGADAIADDLLMFEEAGSPRGRRRFLAGARTRGPNWITAEAYFDETAMFQRRPNLGFLKPVISMEFLRRTGVRYDASMRIGEDDDLVVRLLRAGLRYRLSPHLTYLYRRHSDSISHRIQTSHLEQMIQRAAIYRRDWAGAPLAVTAALGRRESSFISARAFVDAIDRLKEGRADRALAAMLRRPQSLRHFAMPLSARLRRALPPAPAPGATGRPTVAIVSRQRVIGRTNGSSTYLLSLAQAVAAAGLEPHLIVPSPHMFGRWPLLRLKPEMDVFCSVAVRGGVRLGRYILSIEPRRYWAAARAAAGVVLDRLRLPSRWITGEKAPYAIGAAWTDADRLFVARRALPNMAAVLADYVFLAEAFPYLIAPTAPTATVMHDLFHARAESLKDGRATDGVAVIEEPQERALLAKSDAVIAIQSTEAAYVRNVLPASRVILAPMAVEPVLRATPGRNGQLLFVGSSTHPNVIGLQWFFNEIWPKVLEAAPHARLVVAGNINRAFPTPPKGVAFIGVAPDLRPLYEESGVVISPLVAGSGLKIKLIEALAEGKAVVATSITLQGVEREAAQGVEVADDPERFGKAILELLDNEDARRELGSKGLRVARVHFGPGACYAELTAWLRAARARFDAVARAA